MTGVRIQSTSKYSATCSDILVRDGEQVRLFFRPEIVEDPTEPRAAVHGRFVYQRKSRNDRWTDVDKIQLSTLKKDEGYQLRLSADELYTLLHELVPLYRFKQREGIPTGAFDLVKVDRSVTQLLANTEPDILAFLSNHSHNPAEALRAVLRWITSHSSTNAPMSDGQLPELNLLVGLTNLRSLLGIWSSNAGKKDEEYWQKLFADHSYVLSQIFAHPVVMIAGKAYVGGKDISNSGGNLVDFLYRTESAGAAVLVEIKTPETALLGPEYRNGAYRMSGELSGAISQVLEYADSFSRDFHAIRTAESGLSAVQPYSVIVIGNASKELADEKRKCSFERFRERLIGVRIITFDEVFRRLEMMIDLLEGK
ncbi:MAG: Shedu immune nuclease family protein [Acidobacteriota bacterium]